MFLGVDEPPEVWRLRDGLEEGVVDEAAAHAVPPRLLTRLEVGVVLRKWATMWSDIIFAYEPLKWMNSLERGLNLKRAVLPNSFP